MNTLGRWRRLLMPATVFGAVAVVHYVWIGVFPEQDPAQSGWASLEGIAGASWWRRYVETQSYWMGLSCALPLGFAAYALRRYREERRCSARNLAVGGITFSGFLAVLGCYLLGCCGSPMLAVYLNLFGAAFLPLAKPLIAGVTVVLTAGAWFWMHRRAVRNHGLDASEEAPTDCGCPSGAGCAEGSVTAIPIQHRERDWATIGIRLVGATLVYNLLEAVIALWSGVRAASIALMGFGLDSVIEAAAAGVLLWRLSVEAGGAPRSAVEAAEGQVHRFVGATFLALAVYVAAQAGWMLFHHDAPSESMVGMVLAVVSLVVMPLVSVAKLKVAKRIGSAALRSEAKETLACSYLSLTLFLGLAANAAAGWWWADPVAALLMIPWLLKEGLEGLRQGKDSGGDE